MNILFKFLYSSILCLTLISCTQSSPEEKPQFPVDLRIGGSMPDDNIIGEYTISLDKAFIIMGDLTIYGMDRTAAGYLMTAPHPKHAGHLHGEAEMETSASDTYLIDLTGEPQILASNMATEGHYFDGKVRIRPCTDTYSPIYPDSLEEVSNDNEIWENSFLLEGDATKDATTYHFKIKFPMESLITGLVYGGTIKEDGATAITTMLDLNTVLSLVDFETLSDTNNQVEINSTNNTDITDLIKTVLKDPASYFHLEAEPIPSK